MTRRYKRTPCGDCGRPVEIPRSQRCLACQRERQRVAMSKPAPVEPRAAGAQIRPIPSACPPSLRDYAGSEPTRPYVPSYYRGRRRMI